jgi:hypothetical protein
LHCLDEMQVSIALQLEDAKRQTQPPIGDELLGRTVGRLLHENPQSERHRARSIRSD